MHLCPLAERRGETLSLAPLLPPPSTMHTQAGKKRRRFSLSLPFFFPDTQTGSCMAATLSSPAPFLPKGVDATDLKKGEEEERRGRDVWRRS